MQHRSPARSRRLAQRPRYGHSLAAAAIDRPSAAAPIVGRAVDVAGWAWPFEGERVRRVELSIDGAPTGAARLTLRPDICATLGRPEAILSGFEASVDLASAPAPDDQIALSLEVHGLDGGSWTSPDWRLPIGQAGADDSAPRAASTLARGDDTREPADGDWPATTKLDGPDRDWTRRRLGYDPPHVVVLIEEPEIAAGPAIAALDVLAERRPDLELLVPAVRSDSNIADLMQRAAAHTGLEDRVTIPFVPAPAIGWHGVADFALTASTPGATGDDLAALVDTLEGCCGPSR